MHPILQMVDVQSDCMYAFACEPSCQIPYQHKQHQKGAMTKQRFANDVTGLSGRVQLDVRHCQLPHTLHFPLQRHLDGVRGGLCCAW